MCPKSEIKCQKNFIDIWDIFGTLKKIFKNYEQRKSVFSQVSATCDHKWHCAKCSVKCSHSVCAL